jgi:cytochrome P450 family 26 subfamily A
MFLIHVGYTIPKGSKIMINPSSAHLNPTIYKDSNEFNPWRWKVSQIYSKISNAHILANEGEKEG